jgi:NADH-quinone oxidoreductase subunit J
VLVYAGGIVVLYLFVVMLVSLRAVPEARLDPRRQSRLGLVIATAVLAEVIAIVVYTANQPSAAPSPAAQAAPVQGNTQVVGWMLYTDYLVPFEVASVLLLVAMIGAILLARKEA